jgi:hypothetical protein
MRTGKPLMLLAALLPNVTVPAGTQPMLEQLRVDYAAWAAAQSDFRAGREGGSLTGVEASDYAGYVARLRRRVAEDCAAVVAAGIPIPADRSCPELSTGERVRSAAIDQVVEQTREESIAGLDAQLEAGLGAFDERLLQEQERIKAKAATSRSGSDGGSGDRGGGTPGSGTAARGDATAGETRAGMAAASGEGRPLAGGPASPSAASAGGGPVRTPSPGARRAPPGTADGIDDDIVARQLREAAEKETDPELRKKLWDEYRKYKQGTR